MELEVSGKKYVKNKKIALGQSCCLEKQDYILFKLGMYSGVGKIINRDKCYVKVKDITMSGFKLLTAPKQSELIRFNEEIVEKAAEEARSFIRHIYNKYISPGFIHVSFSGGADSTAVLTLAVEELGQEKVIAVTSDTGLEFPENKKYIESLTEKLGVRLVVLKPTRDFLSEISSRGLMRVDNRWCTEFMKLKPLRDYYSSKNVKMYLDGARDYESHQRARSPRLSENPSIPGVYRALPIKRWPRMLVQLYLLSRSIDMNPLYDLGFTRIGCVVCPAMHRHELVLSYLKYQDIHQRILDLTGVSLDTYLSMKWTGRRIFSRD
ncbi:MAG: phosphoadenosine phosphosulfate reductase family protein, partial [Desulfurococcaceae archaeon]